MSIGIFSPHPEVYLSTIRWSTRSTLFWRTMKLRGRFKNRCRKGTLGQVHHPMEARLCWYKINMSPRDSVLTIGRWIRTLYGIGIQSHRFMTFWTSSKGPNISAILNWSLGITSYQLNPLMCGSLLSNVRRDFLNNWPCHSGWWMPPQPSCCWWTTSCSHLPTCSW